MASNGRTARRQVKTSPWDALDQLPQAVRRALYEGPQEWCAVYVLSYYRKQVRLLGEDAIEATVAWVESSHTVEITTGRPWQTKRTRAGWVPSPHMLANATMQRAYVGGHIAIDPQQQEA